MEKEDLATTVLTCEGDFNDPSLPIRLNELAAKLQSLISDGGEPIRITKVEPWNSVRVTFNIPLEAAQRLRQLAERGDRELRELGILSVQIEGDQVITLTLASQFSEPQEIVLRKTSDDQGDVSSVSFNLPNSEPVPGPSSAEPAHKNISQFLGHIVGGATAATATVNSATRLERSASPKLETFRSPNVIAPTSSGPIPFPPAAVITTTAAVPSSSRVSPNVSVKPPAGFGPFPFASMTHAMNTKHSATSPQYQPVIHVQSGNPRISFTTSASQLANAIHNTSSSNVIAPTSVPPKTSSTLQKIPRTSTNSAFNSLVSRVSAPNVAVSVSRANVALSSPLLVNLLQSETSNVQQHTKLMPPPTQASNQAPKRKRKPRKPKEKASEDGNVSSPSFSASPSPPSSQSHMGVRSPGGFDPMNVIGQPLSVPLNNIPTSPLSPQIANLHPMAQGQPPVSNIRTPNISHQTQGLSPVSLPSQVQGQPQVSTARQINHQTLSAFRQTHGHRTVPNIHPQAQGQPQVHTGNLPLHTHIPVGSPQLARPTTGNLQSYSMSAPRSMPMNPTRSIFVNRESTPLVKIMDKPVKEPSLNKSDKPSTPSTPSTSTPDSNPFPSPPSSSDGKTKHLINPFTGQLEPMPSDEDEEEESIGSLPPFPDFEIDTSEKSQSERSLSDGGKDNNLSSDTDSGISKSITDVSQSSTEAATLDSSKDTKKSDAGVKVDSVTTASVTSSIPGEKLKLRLKLDPKTIRESKDSELKEKRLKDNTPQLNQKIDVAVVSIPGLKKGSSLTSTSVPEPRVPPLHISLRGPNAAVVVSPRKDDSKSRYAMSKDDNSSTEAPAKANQKKVRSPRTSRTGDVSSVALSLAGRTTENTDKKVKGNNPKDFKKGKDDFWNQNVKNMSGGGIVEVSEKIAANRLSSYEAYVSGSSVVQHKSSTIFALSSRDTCKSEIMTLTSCATGESVTLHTFSSSKSPLPLQVPSVSETEVLPEVETQAVKKEGNSSVHTTVPSVERTGNTSVLETSANPVKDKLFSLNLGSVKDNSLTSSRKSPLNMQNNYLPHSPSAPVDSKNNVQKSTNHPCDQNQLQSASSVFVVSTVPPSSRSVCVNNSPTHNASETVHDSTVQLPISVISDAKKLSCATDNLVNSVDNVSRNTDGQNHQTNHQCNTHLSNNSSSLTETVKNSVTVDKNVQNESLSKTEPIHNLGVVNEVQSNSIVNNDSTANNSDKSRTEVQNCKSKKSEVINKISNSVTSESVESEKCKQLLFSNHTDSCDLSVSFKPLSTKEVVTDNEDKTVCIVDVKTPPIAQIITVDSLPIQSHVIEVPSLQTSPAVPKKLANSGHAVEVSTIPSLLTSSHTSPFLQARNILVMQESSNVLPINSDRDSPDTCLAGVVPESFLKFNLPNRRTSLTNHISSLQEASSNVKNSPEQHSSSTPSEESSMDSIDEERKRCMQLAEIPTSTPGPPTVESMISSSESSESNKKKETSSSALSKESSSTTATSTVCNIKDQVLCEKPNPKELTSVTSSSQSNDTKLQPSLVASSVKSVSLPDSTTQSVENRMQQKPRISHVSVVSCTESITENHLSISSESFSTTQSFAHSQKDLSQTSEPSVTIASDNSLPQLLTVEDGLSLSIETKVHPSKSETKRDTPISESLQIVSTSCSSTVASLLSPVKYLSPDVSSSSQTFKLIFKGSSQRSSLSGNNSPTSLVVPLNSSKTVPIKLVTLPGGTSALSVRSTSNPNIVEIIGPKSASSQNSPSSSNPHSSSPVRLVVSKMSPGLSGANQGGSSNLRNRVVVKSVVVTSTSPSIKLVSANSVCATTAISSSARATTTSSTRQSNIASLVAPNSLPAHNPKLPVEEELKSTSVENSTMQSSVSCSSHQKTVLESVTLQDSKELVAVNSFCKNLFNTSITSSVDSTKNSSDETLNTSSISETTPKPSNVVDAEVSIKNSVQEVSLPSQNVLSNENLSPSNINIDSCTDFKTNKINQAHSTTNVSQDSVSCKNTSTNVISKNTTCENTTVKNEDSNKKSSNTSAVDSTAKQSTVDILATSSSDISDQCCTESLIKTESTDSCNSKSDISDTKNNHNKKSPSEASGSKSNSKEAISSDSTQSVKTEAAIATSVSDIPLKKPKSPIVITCDSADSPQCPEINSTIKLEPTNVATNSPVVNCIDNNLNSQLDDPCIIENEIVVESNIEVVVSEISDNVEIANVECDGLSLVQSFAVDSLQNNICKDTEVLIKSEDGKMSSLSPKSEESAVDLQSIRPLSQQRAPIENKVLYDGVEAEGGKVIIEDSQLEISLVYAKPLKRKCSENAAELIKACMGVEDGPKRGVMIKPKPAEDGVEKVEGEKLEENVRMSLRLRKEDAVIKKNKGPRLTSDCSSDEEITLSELVTKSRVREKPVRGRMSIKDNLIEPNNLRPGRRRSGSNESRNSEDVKLRVPRESKREIKKEEIKKMPERTKRGTVKAQEQVVVSKVAMQRSGRIRDQEVKPNSINNSKEETNSIGTKRKTRGTTEAQEMVSHMKRRRYSKDGHR